MLRGNPEGYIAASLKVFGSLYWAAPGREMTKVCIINTYRPRSPEEPKTARETATARRAQNCKRFSRHLLANIVLLRPQFSLY